MTQILINVQTFIFKSLESQLFVNITVFIQNQSIATPLFGVAKILRIWKIQ
jgi:hypothetical protein